MNYEWNQMDPNQYMHGNEYDSMMRPSKHGHGGGHHGGKHGHHGGGHHGKPGYHGGGHGHGNQGGYFGGGLPFLGGLAGGLLAGSLINSPNYYPYNTNPYYGGYPQYPYPPYPYYPYPPYGGYY